MKSDKVRHEKYKMVVTVDIDTDRLISILCNAALMVIACIILVAYVVPLVGDLSARVPYSYEACFYLPESSALDCPTVPSEARRPLPLD